MFARFARDIFHSGYGIQNAMSGETAPLDILIAAMKRKVANDGGKQFADSLTDMFGGEEGLAQTVHGLYQQARPADQISLMKSFLQLRLKIYETQQQVGNPWEQFSVEELAAGITQAMKDAQQSAIAQ